MSKKKITLIGAAGRMGKAIIQAFPMSKLAELTYALVRPDSYCIGLDSGLHAGGKENKVLFSSNIEEAIQNSDGVIDFSSLQNLENVLALCKKYKKPLVTGLTGLSEFHWKILKETSQEIPIVYSPNMSIGVNLLFKLTEISAKVLGESFDIEIQDIHHRHKKDSPSGTAMKLKNILLETLSRDESCVIYGRHGIYQERPRNEIGIHTIRAGEVVGEHTVFFFSAEERLEITHKAQDRKAFGVGTIKAIDFALEQKPGLYDMFHVLGI